MVRSKGRVIYLTTQHGQKQWLFILVTNPFILVKHPFIGVYKNSSFPWPICSFSWLICSFSWLICSFSWLIRSKLAKLRLNWKFQVIHSLQVIWSLWVIRLLRKSGRRSGDALMMNMWFRVEMSLKMKKSKKIRNFNNSLYFGTKINFSLWITRYQSWHLLIIFVISEVFLRCGLESVLINCSKNWKEIIPKFTAISFFFLYFILLFIGNNIYY